MTEQLIDKGHDELLERVVLNELLIELGVVAKHWSHRFFHRCSQFKSSLPLLGYRQQRSEPCNVQMQIIARVDRGRRNIA